MSITARAMYASKCTIFIENIQYIHTDCYVAINGDNAIIIPTNVWNELEAKLRSTNIKDLNNFVFGTNSVEDFSFEELSEVKGTTLYKGITNSVIQR